MDNIQIVFVVISAIALFLYGLDHFSREIQAVGKERFGARLERFASNRWRGFALGAVFTGAVQSSSATSALAVSLVNARLISFRNSLAILFGANVGTTLTAQIVALKLTGIGPVFISLGFLLSLVAHRLRPLGRVIFYFGFIFFSLELIGTSLEPMRNNVYLLDLIRQSHTPILGLLVGAVATFILQSSSVSTGIVVMLVQQGVLGLDAATYMVLGANIGTTGTAILASIRMSAEAKRSAFANTVFNVAGIALFLPFLPSLQAWLSVNVDEVAQVVSLIHLSFNCIASLVFLILLRQFEWLVLRTQFWGTGS